MEGKLEDNERYVAALYADPEGSRRQFDLLMGNYRGAIIGTATHRLRVEDDRETVFVDTCMTMWEHFLSRHADPGLERIENISGFILKVADHEALNLVRINGSGKRTALRYEHQLPMTLAMDDDLEGHGDLNQVTSFDLTYAADLDLVDLSDQVLSDLELSDLVTEIQELLDELPSHQRAAIEEVLIEDRPQTAVAEEAGIATSTLSDWINNFRDRLQGLAT